MRPGARAGLAGGAGALAAALAVAARRGARRATTDVEFGLLWPATLLALPKSWEHYGVLLLFAYLAVFRLAAGAAALARLPCC